MPFRWINLYSIPPNERVTFFEKLLFNKKKHIEGSFYTGRILMSLSMTPNDKCDRGVFSLNSFRDPPITKYFLRVDTYEL